ncbi:MAG TPA: leucine-rich repeat domain-containing protein, partial [Bacteroidales bacterium]|nr:leucine-rich repeat domain-containing protein [Bacteroidales bacterium]
MRNRYTAILIILLCFFLLPATFAQQRKPQTTKKPVDKHQVKKTATNGAKTTKTSTKTTEKDTRSTTITNFTPEQIEGFKQQSAQLVKFFEGTLNFLADKRNPVKEKQTIVTSSYLKSFWDDKVQVEDDLDEKRLVSLYKDIPAYLTDVDFFFKRAKFTYTVQEVAVMTNEIGQTYFKVTANRTLTGLTVNDDSVNSNKVRYIEINYDDSKQQLKIVSIYTTKLNEQNDMRNWWNALPQAWKDIFGKDVQIDAGKNLNQVTLFSDSISTVNGEQMKLDAPRIYPLLTRIITLGNIDLSGNASVTDLTPLGKLSGLKEVNLSGTPVSDLMPLKNLNDLEVLDISGTQVISLEPLRYSNHIKILKMKGTKIPDLEMIANFSDLSELDLSSTPVTSLAPLKDLTALRDLRFSNTGITDLTPLTGLTQLTILYFSDTKVEDITPLAGLKNLQVTVFDKTNVKSLSALENSPQLIRVFCDNSKVARAEAIGFMVKHPEILVIFATDELQKWWTAMSPEWKKVFNQYRKIDASPTSEQLHRLATID